MMNNPADYCGNDFDCEADFTQILEETKRNVDQKTLKTAQVDDKQRNPVKKNRKSWKRSLFSWLKIDKKTDTNRENVFETKCGSVLSPVHSTAGRITSRRPSSGPLSGGFRPTKKVPYMCLGHIDDPHKLQSYGPVYLVT